MNITHTPRYFGLALIVIYQKTLSPDHSFWAKRIYPFGYCRFNPTCSNYGYESIKKYGLLRGGVKTLWRIFRCNPWNKGGVDPVQ